METNISFGGFYNSMHDYVIDDFVETWFQNDEGERPEDFWDLFDNVDWKRLKTIYCNEYVDFINDRVGINLQYKSLNSPREYNFYTDVIEVTFTDNDMEGLRRYLRNLTDYFNFDDDVDEYVREATTTRDGYIPFYKYDEYKADNELMMMCYLELLSGYINDMDYGLWYEWYDTIDDVLWTEGV